MLPIYRTALHVSPYPEERTMKAYSIALLTCIATTAAAAQSPRQVAIIGCRNATSKEVRAKHTEADSVQLASHPRVSEPRGNDVEVRGEGRYFDGARREWRPFTYDCTYNTRSAATRVKVRTDSREGTQ
jgi:hypothetical protein